MPRRRPGTTRSLPLTICIPTYNRARLLARTLRHLTALTELFSEVVISDNASSDDTQAVIAEFRAQLPRLRCLRQSANRGLARNVFAAMMFASSKYCFVLCDDDALIPVGFERAVAALEEDPACVAVYGGYERCDADLQEVGTTVVPTFPGRYARTDMEALSRNGNILCLPVARTEVIQRYCHFDRSLLFHMRWIAQLLAHGVVRVLPHAIYRHAATPNSIEAQLSEPAYQDGLRADWEVYVASMGKVGLAEAMDLVTHRTVPMYPTAQAIARAQDKPLDERTFLLRYLAYTRAFDPDADERIREWERTRLVPAVIAKLADHLEMTPGISRVVVETGTMQLAVLMAQVQKRLPGLAVITRPTAKFIQSSADDQDFLLAEYWDSLDARGARHRDDPGRRLAVGDLVASLRIPQGSGASPLLEGPDGSLHFSRR